MDKLNRRGPVSPYLERPLRSLDEARKDQAEPMRQEEKKPLQTLNQQMTENWTRIKSAG